MAEDDPSAVRGAHNRDRKHRSGGNDTPQGRSHNGQGPRPASRPPGQHRDTDKPAASGAGSGNGQEQATPTRNPFIRPPHHRQAYAALDLGTNNCRLLIARPEGENFTVIDAFSRVVRLGEGLAHNGRLSDDAMERTLAALHVCAGKLRRRRVHLARSVATEACRRAANGAEFIERVRKETGIVLDIISAREEARLAVLGCHVLLEHGEGPAMIFDIGGGSTELVLVETSGTIPTIIDWQSVPWGVVSLTEAIGPEPDGPETEASRTARLERYATMTETVADSFADFAERIAPSRRASRFGEGGLRLLGTSGTVTTLASLHLELPQYDRGAVDGLIMPSQGMREIADRLSALSPEERGEVPCIGHDRAELVVAGCAILETILELWPAERLGVADRGIREGILRSMMASGLQGEQARRDIVAGRGDAQ